MSKDDVVKPDAPPAEPEKPTGPKRPKTPAVGDLSANSDTLAVLRQCGFDTRRMEREARKLTERFESTDARAHVALKSVVNVEFSHVVRDALVSTLAALLLKAVAKSSDDL